jgi:hypothetical protein
MSMPYYYVMGQIHLAVHTSDHHADVREALGKTRLSKDALEAGRKLVEAGEKLVERKLEEAGEDRIVEHGIHGAIEELEMWMQTVRYRLRKAELDGATIARTMGEDIHPHDHALGAVARTFRILGELRANGAIHDKIGTGRSTHDLIVRGHTLLRKMLNYTETRLAPTSATASMKVFSELAGHGDAMARWVDDKLAPSAQTLAKNPAAVALLGYVPEGVGLPVGGTSFAVPLHQYARSTPPDPADVRATSGWSIGRQGRNRENLGKGFIDPTFE